jgi:hypothetical protein
VLASSLARFCDGVLQRAAAASANAVSPDPQQACSS